jgi:hypothetical protein
MLSYSAVSQRNDSIPQKGEKIEYNALDSARMPYVYVDDYLSNSYLYTDTTLINLQRFDPNKRDRLYTSQGALGNAHSSLTFDAFNTLSYLFDVGETSYSQYYFDWRKNPMYFPTTPISEVYYTTASNEEQLLYVTLANQVSKTVYIGLDLQTQKYLGGYKRQEVSNNQFRINTSYTSLSNRYHAHFNFTRNKFQLQENGGISDLFYVEDTVIDNRLTIPVNMYDAENVLVSQNYFYRQRLGLGKKKDSSDQYSLGFLFGDFIFGKKYRKYTNGQLGYYANNYLDTLATFDSIGNKQMTFRVGWLNNSTLFNTMNMKIWLEYKMVEHFDNFKALRFDYMAPHFAYSLNTKISKLNLLANFQVLNKYSDFKYGDQNYNLFASAEQKIYKDLSLNGKFRMSYIAPDFKFIDTYSNHYRWFNPNYSNMTITAFDAGMDFYGVKFNVNVSNVSNYTAFYENIGPKQNSKNLNYLSVKLQKDLHMNHFGLSILGAYQEVNDRAIYEVPKLAGRLSMYTYFRLFKKVLTLEPGIDVYAVSEYHAPIWDPALASFVQQQSSALGNQIFADVYINVKIKRARVFLKYQHANALFMDPVQYLTLNNPMQDANFKAGVSWKFYD